MENENICAKEAIKTDTRKTIMVELIRKGAKPEEIKEFLDLLGEVQFSASPNNHPLDRWR